MCCLLPYGASLDKQSFCFNPSVTVCDRAASLHERGSEGNTVSRQKPIIRPPFSA